MRSPSTTRENVPSDIRDAATRSGAEVLAALRSSPSGLTAEEFRPLPWPFFLALVAMVVLYLGCVELAKARFFARQTRRPVSHGPVIAPMHRYERRLHRRSARFTTPAPSRSSQ